MTNSAAADDDSGPLLDVVDLHVRYHAEHGLVRAVNGLTYAVQQGEAVAFVGESGSGKTAAALSLLGLLPQEGYIESGHVYFAGVDLLACSERELRATRGARIGIVFQDPLSSLNPTLTVGLQISEAIQAHQQLRRAEARARAVELLTSVGIPHAAKRAGQYPHQFSGGMRQRVMIAMALSCEPRLLIADEPTTALDVTVQAQILDLLMDLRARLSMAIVLITHDLAVAARVADRICVMYAGCIVEAGTTDQVLNSPRHPYTIGLLASSPSLTRPRGMLRPIPGTPPDLAVGSQGCAFMARCSLSIDKCATTVPPLERVDAVPPRDVACWVAMSKAAQATNELVSGEDA